MQFSAACPSAQPPPIEASLLEAPAEEAPPPVYAPPPMDVVYSLPTPQEITIETETISEMTGTAITSPGPVTAVVPPMVESVEYVRAAPPVYPKESQRRREHGTVVLRVLVDAQGRPAQIQVEHSSGFERLDDGGARGGREIPVPSLRSEWRGAARPGADPDRIRSPRLLIRRRGYDPRRWPRSLTTSI